MLTAHFLEFLDQVQLITYSKQQVPGIVHARIGVVIIQQPSMNNAQHRLKGKNLITLLGDKRLTLLRSLMQTPIMASSKWFCSHIVSAPRESLSAGSMTTLLLCITVLIPSWQLQQILVCTPFRQTILADAHGHTTPDFTCLVWTFASSR